MARLLARKAPAGADDLEILFPDASVPIAGQLWTVREYTLLEGIQCGEAAQRALVKHRTPLTIEMMDAETTALIQSRELIELIAFNCGRDVLHVAALDDDEFESLVSAWSRVNAKWLTPEKPVASRGGRPQRWSTIFQLLVTNGHALEATRGYTMRQVQLFCDAIHRAERRARAARIVDVNLGFAGGDAAKSTVKQLED